MAVHADEDDLHRRRRRAGSAVNNSTADDPALALASAGKIENRDESGYNIGWCIGLAPYTALLNCESLFVAAGCDNPAGARLFIRYVMGGADGTAAGYEPFQKEGNWPVRDDMTNDKNPAQLDELGAIETILAPSMTSSWIARICGSIGSIRIPTCDPRRFPCGLPCEK